MSNGTTFVVTVEEEGDFEFRHRNMKLEFAIERSFSLHTGGQPNPAPQLADMSRMIAVLETLTIKGPEKFNIWAMDPLDDASYQRIGNVYKVLRERETFFRTGRGKGSEAGGTEGGQKSGVVVPDQVQPAGD